ncbi:MAG TPA: type II toxin-antitoxin system VapC family toxin [bacterium]|nr:type II toxin-antitoxin system VapC family toxin [bacterium]HQO35424.1 type II toxin-antitoxin system VapC family toxin [bacterium]HQP98754.1 type II toxin-antitoxin system VapC family toxin [bacterium]
MESSADRRGLIDTDILVDALKGNERSKQFLYQQRTGGTIQISVITAMELIRGCRNAGELRSLLDFLDTFSVLPIGPVATQKSYQWMVSYSLSHGLQIPDALIAGTAVEHDLTLFTGNTRHFRMIPEIVVEQPY